MTNILYKEVAEKVMGWKRDTRLPRLSIWIDETNFSHNWPGISSTNDDIFMVVNRLNSLGFEVILISGPKNKFSCEVAKPSWSGSEVWEGDTLIEALFKAALAALKSDE